MRRCKTVWACSALLLITGCAMLRQDDQLTSSYGLPGDEDPDQGIISDVAENFMRSARASVGLGPNEEVAKQQFSESMSLYREAAQLEGAARGAKFDKAAKAFGRAASRWPNSSIEEDAMFYRAESYYFADRYPKAETVFGELLAKYQSSKYIDKVSQRRFLIAKYWLDHHKQHKELAIAPNFASRDRPRFDKFGNAIKILERIRLDDPTGELADDATMLAASACFESGRYYRADELLDDLRRSFPNSKHQYQGHMLGLKCKVQLYQGPNYSGSPLDDAEELVKQMRRQFPRESQGDQEFLAKAFKDVRMNRAVREMNLARYRDRRKEYRAAKTQYNRVAREYSDTSLAAEAEERLAQLGGAPDLPPQRLEFLAKMFPADEEQRPLIATKPGPISR